MAAKAAAPRSAPKQEGVGEKSVYTVLGSRLREAKKKKEAMEKAKADEAVVDDWEEEVRKEEEQGGDSNKAVDPDSSLDDPPVSNHNNVDRLEVDALTGGGSS